MPIAHENSKGARTIFTGLSHIFSYKFSVTKPRAPFLNNEFSCLPRDLFCSAPKFSSSSPQEEAHA